MGRKRVMRKESLTTLSAYLPEAMIVDDEQRPNESSKAETLRRIFIAYFGEDRIREKRKEIQKKLDRHELIHTGTGDQYTLDNEYPKKTYKDSVWSQEDLLSIIIEAKQFHGKLAKANALDSINKAVNRGDIERVERGFKVIHRYWEKIIV